MPDVFDPAVDSFLDTVQTLVTDGQLRSGGSGVIPLPAELDILDWQLPAWLHAITTAHHGLGPWWDGVGWGRPAILPLTDVRPLTANIRFGEENITFDPADALLFTPDARGGGVVLCDRDDPVLRLFDGQRHRLGARLSKDAYLDGLLTSWTARPTSTRWPWL